MNEQKVVLYHREGYFGFITLNRPEKRNAMNWDLWLALEQAIIQAEEDRDSRVVILKGEGKSFCSGLDLGPENELLKAIGGTSGATQKLEFFRLVKRGQEIFTRLERLTKPTIAVIHGHCFGAGLELVLCCDMRFCSAETLFALPEPILAIITDAGGLQRLPRVVGRGHAREIAFRGHRFTAERARAINLVNEVYPDLEALETQVKEIAEEIASNPPLAVQGIKEVLVFNEGAGLERSLDYTAARSSMILPSEDLFEAIAAYMEKRKGNFKGA
ncbi:MAG: enoyl-CoA hydratase [Desulfobacca sp.]|nr:enoyl-CoA hydratase [Desulfobacca sp.]